MSLFKIQKSLETQESMLAQKFAGNTAGATSIEYALIAAVIGISVVLSMSTIREKVKQKSSCISNVLGSEPENFVENGCSKNGVKAVKEGDYDPAF